MSVQIVGGTCIHPDDEVGWFFSRDGTWRVCARCNVQENRGHVFEAGDVAQQCGVTLRTVRRWVCAGKLQGPKLKPHRGCARFIYASSVDALMAQRAGGAE